MAQSIIGGERLLNRVFAGFECYRFGHFAVICGFPREENHEETE
jgi:hypothetical protein